MHKGCENTDGYNCQNVGKKLVFLDTSNIKAFSHFIRHRRCPLPPFEGNLYTLLGKVHLIILPCMIASLKCQQIPIFNILSFLESLDILTTLNTIRISEISQCPIVGVLSTDLSSRS